MADTKISALPAATVALGADEIPINEAGTSKKLTVTQLMVLATLSNYSVAAQTFATASRTYIIGSAIAIPAGKLRIGTILKWHLNIVKTAAGVSASTYDIAFGTTGTISDTARVSFTKKAGTGVIDTAEISIYAIVRGPLSASGVVVGCFNLNHDLAATGHATTANVVVTTISSAFDVTTPTYVGVCVTTGALDVITTQLVVAETVNL